MLMMPAKTLHKDVYRYRADASNTTRDDATTLKAINTMVKTLDTNGLWDKTYSAVVQAKTEEDSLIDIKGNQDFTQIAGATWNDATGFDLGYETSVVPDGGSSRPAADNISMVAHVLSPNGIQQAYIGRYDNTSPVYNFSMRLDSDESVTGSDEITNGNFASGLTGWTSLSADPEYTFSVVTGELNIDSTASAAAADAIGQSVSATANRVYRIYGDGISHTDVHNLTGTVVIDDTLDADNSVTPRIQWTANSTYPSSKGIFWESGAGGTKWINIIGANAFSGGADTLILDDVALKTIGYAFESQAFDITDTPINHELATVMSATAITDASGTFVFSRNGSQVNILDGEDTPSTDNNTFEEPSAYDSTIKLGGQDLNYIVGIIGTYLSQAEMVTYKAAVDQYITDIGI